MLFNSLLVLVFYLLVGLVFDWLFVRGYGGIAYDHESLKDYFSRLIVIAGWPAILVLLVKIDREVARRKP